MRFIVASLVLVASLAVASDAKLLLTPHAIRQRVQEKLGSPMKKEGSPYAIREAIFTQWLDHFDTEEFLTFDQSIFINDNYYVQGGPVFIYITSISGGFSEWLEYSHVTSIAAQLNGVIYGIEPRYTGNSRPTEDLSIESLARYSTLNQTVADIADIVTYLRISLSIYGSDKFILYGFDTGATLATWVHQSNPGLIDGVWAIGAPVTVGYEFAGFLADATESIAEIIRDLDLIYCGYTLNNAIYDLENLIYEKQTDKIQQLFGLKTPLDLENPNEIGIFYYLIYNIIAYHVEYGSALQVNNMCEYLTYYPELDAIERFGLYIGSYFYDTTIDYNEIVSILRDESWDGQAADTRQYFHLACRQWSWFRTSSYLDEPINQKFTNEVFSNLCYDVFGVGQYETIDGNIRANNEYTIRVGLSNVYFTNGGLDPVRLISVRNNLNPFSPADVIPGIGKAFELVRYLDDAYLSDELIAVRQRATSLITTWTAQ